MKRDNLKRYIWAGILTTLLVLTVNTLLYFTTNPNPALRWFPTNSVLEWLFGK
ncbi:hypothetical protein NE648_08820 [Alistipes shahii]|uniref:hypothetical protein n=1 Tax=Alistipes shahii TaxID=328814 RepID=UPI00210DC88A|nr:hypothetical protein [Alistipes shahii]MCQ5074146.1 hypothetical protein [Alistipes shahii]